MSTRRTRTRLALLTATVAACLLACTKGESPASTSSPPAPAPDTPPPSVTAAGPSTPLVLAPANQLRWTDAPAGTRDVAALVRDALSRAREDGRTLLVYVGATWCEPCQRFHHAVEHGELDAAFPKLTILAFDADRDGESLATAGYVSRLIPLFALPAPDGRASGKSIQGSVKGQEAVGEITPRLRDLINGV